MCICLLYIADASPFLFLAQVDVSMVDYQVIRDIIFSQTPVEVFKECRSNPKAGLFYRPDVDMQLLMQKHEKVLHAIIDKRLNGAKKTDMQLSLAAVDDMFEGQLQIQDLSKAEWVRKEAFTLKSIFVYIREVEYRSVDFSRLPAHVAALCRAHRLTKEQVWSKKRSCYYNMWHCC